MATKQDTLNQVEAYLKSAIVTNAYTSIIIPLLPRSCNLLGNSIKLNLSEIIADQCFQRKPKIDKKTSEIKVQEPVSMWESVSPDQGAKREVEELTPAFRRLLNYQEAKEDAHENDQRVKCFNLSNTIWEITLKRLFLNTEKKIGIERVRLFVYPLNTIFICIDLSWNQSLGSICLSDLLKALDIARHIRGDKQEAWRLPPPDPNPNPVSLEGEQRAAWDSALRDHERSLGAPLYAALYTVDSENPQRLGSISTLDLIHFLLAPLIGQLTLQSESYALHHSSVTLSAPLAEEAIPTALFRLRRMYNDNYLAPTEPQASSIETSYQIRDNRWVTIAREGTASLNWPASEQDTFNRTQWRDKWRGVYLRLALQAHSERLTIAGLELEISEELSAPLSDQKTRRKNLREIVKRITRFSLSVVDDCGGVSDYVRFYSTTRLILGSQEYRLGLCRDAQNVLSNIEVEYQELELKLESDISRWGGAALPLMLVCSFYGMNDLPRYIAEHAFSVTIIVGICSIYIYSRIRNYGDR